MPRRRASPKMREGGRRVPTSYGGTSCSLKRGSRIMVEVLSRSAAGVGANHRAVCRARSRSEFIAKMGVGVDEAGEHGLEMLEDSGILDKNAGAGLPAGANEVLAIVSASSRTATLRTPGVVNY